MPHGVVELLQSTSLSDTPHVVGGEWRGCNGCGGSATATAGRGAWMATAFTNVCERNDKPNVAKQMS